VDPALVAEKPVKAIRHFFHDLAYAFRGGLAHWDYIRRDRRRVAKMLAARVDLENDWAP
jgi:hypothetical protein